MGIPLDMMTITIAAITIGIAVIIVSTIFVGLKKSIKIKNYEKTSDMSQYSRYSNFKYFYYYCIWFFNLNFIKFIPTIYFGIFTGIAMLLAMISVLTLLPKLLLIYKPFGQDS